MLSDLERGTSVRTAGTSARRVALWRMRAESLRSDFVIVPSRFFKKTKSEWCPAARGVAIPSCSQTWIGRATCPLPLGPRRRITPDGWVHEGKSWPGAWDELPTTLTSRSEERC